MLFFFRRGTSRQVGFADAAVAYWSFLTHFGIELYLKRLYSATRTLVHTTMLLGRVKYGFLSPRTWECSPNDCKWKSEVGCGSCDTPEFGSLDGN